jgi:hypothetical protein
MCYCVVLKVGYSKNKNKPSPLYHSWGKLLAVKMLGLSKIFVVHSTR